ncbi:ROK family protein [Nonomuraea aridisoli]|uniref:Sugar kinase n=1 Tax=Nonomuraea aridisoli TaxID=2070368 RepID=A0A2W2E3A1_9ACTN|nr:ROK family protein [Nonomuraea aridisoli]PZG17073.1 sugar kinase [Nonomuraea aridisoli]
MDCVAAVDVGGTTMKGGLVARHGTLLRVERRPTPRAEGPQRVVAAISGFVADLAEPGAGTRPLAVGVAVPGLVTPTHAVFAAAFGWRDVPAAAFADVDLPVTLGHDVRSAGEAELARGAGDGDVLFLPVGTGIAGAMTLSGSLYGGANGWAGQIGHIPVRPDGLACGCGQRGCLAAYASGGAMAARLGVPGAADVVRLASEGDAEAVRVWAEAVEALAVALATYTLVADPAAIVVGGGVSQAGDALIVPLRERLAHRLGFRQAPRVRASALGPLAGLIGAGLLAWRSLAG